MNKRRGGQVPVVTRRFPVNNDVLAITEDTATPKPFTWNSELPIELTLVLNAAAQLEDLGWAVGIECPVKGIQRSYRIPVFAAKDKTALILKPTADSKKVNVSGLKMLDIKSEVQKMLPDFELKAVVVINETVFDERRRSSSDYEVWLRGNSCLF